MTTNVLLRQSQILGNKRKKIPPILPISASAWWAGINSGRFPKPIKLGPRTTCWRASEVYALIENIEVKK